MKKFSVLMSVYYSEKAKWLQTSLESVFNQTVKPTEVVLVEDGPLTDELYAVIAKFKDEHAELKSVKLPVNSGLGKALNVGLKQCSYPLVARMDSDDISKPYRFEQQLQYFEEHPDVDVCSSWIDEFQDDVDNITAIKKLPETHDALYEYGKMRCPVNHPSVMFRRDAVLMNGSYQDYPLLEDYFLWVRMMTNGCTFHCLQESLLFFRANREMYKRRGGIKYALIEVRFQHLLYGLRYIRYGTLLKNIFIRFVMRIIPGKIRMVGYRVMRNKF